MRKSEAMKKEKIMERFFKEIENDRKKPKFMYLGKTKVVFDQTSLVRKLTLSVRDKWLDKILDIRRHLADEIENTRIRRDLRNSEIPDIKCFFLARLYETLPENVRYIIDGIATERMQVWNISDMELHIIYDIMSYVPFMFPYVSNAKDAWEPEESEVEVEENQANENECIKRCLNLKSREASEEEKEEDDDKTGFEKITGFEEVLEKVLPDLPNEYIK